MYNSRLLHCDRFRTGTYVTSLKNIVSMSTHMTDNNADTKQEKVSIPTAVGRHIFRPLSRS